MPTSLVLGSARAQFTITLSASATEPVSVDWMTREGTALAGRDYETNSGTVVFAPGETSKTVEVFIHGRTVETEDRVFYVLMTPPVNAILADEVGACVIHVDTTGSQPVLAVVIPKGEKGERGYSAYEIALQNGFVGTEAEWLASLRPSPEELAPLVAPLINAGEMLVTAAGTEAKTPPDTAKVKDFAGRIAYMRRSKSAIAAALIAGVNIVPMSAFAGDAVDPTNHSGFIVAALRGSNLVGLDWEYLPDSNEIKITGATAGDVPIAIQQDIGSGDVSKAPVKVGGSTKQLRTWLDGIEQRLGDLVGRTEAMEAFAGLIASLDGASTVGWKRSTLFSDIDTVAKMLDSQALSLWEYANLITSKPNPGDATTWDWAPAFEACMADAALYKLDVRLPPIWMKTSRKIVVPKGIIVRGCGGGGYITEIIDQSAWHTVITKTNGNTGGDCVIELEEAAQLFDVQVAPERREFAVWDSANYILGSGNTNVGIRMQKSSRCDRVTAIAFPECGFELGMIVKCTDCFAFMNVVGYKARLGTGDASLVECIGMFNYQYGALLQGGYWKVVGGRWEWNARYGIQLGSSGMVVGATFDRNGWSGVRIPQDMPGNVITGCVFRRNGAGGDGQFGRTGWMTPTDDGYVFTDTVNSSHIRWDGAERTTVTGCYFSGGKDDNNGGADAPRHVYTCGAAAGAIPLDNINVVGNAGDRDETWPGYAPAYNGGGASTWGGTETRIIGYYGKRGQYLANGVRSDAFSGSVPESSGMVAGLTVKVPKGSSGRIMVRAAQAGAAEYSEVYFATNALGTGYRTQVNNIFGTIVSGATMGAGDAIHDHVALTFLATCYAKCSVFTA